MCKKDIEEKVEEAFRTDTNKRCPLLDSLEAKHFYEGSIESLDKLPEDWSKGAKEMFDSVKSKRTPLIRNV